MPAAGHSSQAPGSSPPVLLVEDDPQLAAAILGTLHAHHFVVEHYSLATEALAALRRTRFGVVVLDLMLPDMSGMDLLAQLEHELAPPVLVLTACADLPTRLQAFELGAADYLAKPFFGEELVARLRARMKGSHEAQPAQLRWADLRVDIAARTVHRGVDELDLTASEFNVLEYLLTRPGRALSREQICEAALSQERDAAPRTVDTHIARLRKKIGPDASAAIRTVWSIGYRFEP